MRRAGEGEPGSFAAMLGAGSLGSLRSLMPITSSEPSLGFDDVQARCPAPAPGPPAHLSSQQQAAPLVLLIPHKVYKHSQAQCLIHAQAARLCWATLSKLCFALSHPRAPFLAMDSQISQPSWSLAVNASIC